MIRMLRGPALALTLAALLTVAAGRGAAQAVIVPPPTVCEAPPPAVAYYPPSVSYYTPPAVSYYTPPAVSYYTPPAVSYYAAPAASYYAPATSYYAPATEAVTTYRRGILPGREIVRTRYYYLP